MSVVCEKGFKIQYSHCIKNIPSRNLDTRQVDATGLSNFLLDILCFDVDGAGDIVNYSLHPRDVDGHAVDRFIVFAISDRTDGLDSLEGFSDQTRNETRGCGRWRAGSNAYRRQSDGSTIDKSCDSEDCGCGQIIWAVELTFSAIVIGDELNNRFTNTIAGLRLERGFPEWIMALAQGSNSLFLTYSGTTRDCGVAFGPPYTARLDTLT